MASGCVPGNGGRRAGAGRSSNKSLLATERSERDTHRSVQSRIAIYVIFLFIPWLLR